MNCRGKYIHLELSWFMKTNVCLQACNILQEKDYTSGLPSNILKYYKL